jgi:uncharacterized protein (TIGR02246 family)
VDDIDIVIAKQQCADLSGRYCRAVNECDVEAFTALFTPDGEWNRPGGHSMVGQDAIREYIAYALADPAQRTLRHVNGTVLVDVVDEANATSWSQTTVYDTPTGGPFPVALSGPDMIVEYRDRLVKASDGWRIAQRNTTVVFSVHEVPGAPQ